MSERRFVLGTGAVLVGVGTALLSGTGVAGADVGDTDTAGQQPTNSSAQASTPSPAANAGKGRRGAAAKSPTDAGATNDSSRSARVPQAARASSAVQPDRASKNRAPVTPNPATAIAPAAIAPAEGPSPAEATVVTPDIGVAQAAQPTQSAPAAPIARRAQIVAAATGVGSVPAAYAAPSPAPAASLLLNVFSAFGWRPDADLMAASPALAAWANPRLVSTPAAVVGASSAAAAPPDPTAYGAALAEPLLPGTTNGVTGVQVGHSRLEMPGAFIGDTVAADWYFPTLADGTVEAQGVIWLQHGFGASNTFYSALATELAQKTNSIVVAPTLTSIPFSFSGGCLICSTSQQAAADLFLQTDRTTLVASARDAGYTGDESELQGAFVLSGHSAGGGFATATAADYVAAGSDLKGVVMFDGVSNGTFDGSFTDQLATLVDVPVYQIAAPAQAWNNFGTTTNQLLGARPGVFNGAVLVGGSHVDSMLGVNPVIDFVLQLVTGFSPTGSTAAVYNLSTGWINDLYGGYTPDDPQYGLYSAANEQIISGGTAAVSLPTQFANNLSPLDTILKDVIDAVGSLFGLTPTPPVNTGPNGVVGYEKPPLSNGVTGVRTGSSALLIPSGDNGVNALASWYFPTQADGSVQANGLIWLQHGSSRGLQVPLNLAYTALAQALAQETNSIVVAPADYGTPFDRDAAATMFLGDRTELNVSANAAGYSGTLPQTFVLTGHSAGGGFATAVGATIVDNGYPAKDDLLGVVMFDGFSRPPTFLDQLQTLKDATIPVYQIAAPPQSPGNAWGLATEAMLDVYEDQFFGVQIDAGSHNDSLGGTDFLAYLASEIIPLIGYRPSPPGAKAAVRTFATGWINDLYDDRGPTDPFYGIYGPNYVAPTPYKPAGYNQAIVMGEAGATTLPAPPPVVVDKYLGTWYEQGSVRQFFSLGLVNTTATYSLNENGSIKVENSGNYFVNNGPQSSITGSAVSVNPDYNTRLQVGFFFAQPNPDEPAAEPGNYWILDYGPVVDGQYQWAIVGDPNGTSGYILTRDKIVDGAEYDALVARAYQLGVNRPIIRTQQFPAAAPAGVLPGPATLPATIRV
jgi:lipocalin